MNDITVESFNDLCIKLKPSWLATYKSEYFALNQTVNRGIMSRDKLIAMIYNDFLNSDLSETSEPSLVDGVIELDRLEGKHILQVYDTKKVSVNLLTY